MSLQWTKIIPKKNNDFAIRWIDNLYIENEPLMNKNNTQKSNDFSKKEKVEKNYARNGPFKHLGTKNNRILIQNFSYHPIFWRKKKVDFASLISF